MVRFITRSVQHKDSVNTVGETVAWFMKMPLKAVLEQNYEKHEEEEEMEPTNVLDQSMRYSILEKTFENLDVAYDFYNGYGLSKGFGIRKNQVNRRKKTNEIYRRIFVCNKQGYKDMNDKRHLGDDVKRRCIVRTGCEAMMQVTLSDHGE
ncbi:FAR1-related sequence 5-like protein [Tanacetum coccineum]